LTREGLDQLLAALAPSPEAAGERYERIRRKLIRFFHWEGSLFPEEDADRVLDRVARRLGEGETIRDLDGYFHGVARLVLLESLRDQKKQPQALDPADPPAAAAGGSQETEALYTCLDRCLNRLPPESRSLVLEYYHGDKQARITHRKQLARRFCTDLNALRNRALRLRGRLEACLRGCLDQKGPR
jgi:DNA-directed RNA polymerase specialized sigma24 family protein